VDQERSNDTRKVPLNWGNERFRWKSDSPEPPNTPQGRRFEPVTARRENADFGRSRLSSVDRASTVVDAIFARRRSNDAQTRHADWSSNTRSHRGPWA
jgi:hypothetical protein